MTEMRKEVGPKAGGKEQRRAQRRREKKEGD